MRIIYKYARYHVSGQREHDTLDAAIEDAWSDHEFGEAYPKRIENSDGEVILDGLDLLDKIYKFSEWWDKQKDPEDAK